MKRLFLISLLAIVSSAPTLAQSKAERDVLKLNKEYEEAIARRDASVHERLFAGDYTYTPRNGSFMGREDHMNFTKSGAVVVTMLRSEDVSARVYGNTAVVTGLWVSVDSRDGKEFAERRGESGTSSSTCGGAGAGRSSPNKGPPPPGETK